MKHLLNFITESNDIMSLKKKLMDYLENNDFDAKDLKRAYKVLQKIDDEDYKKLLAIYSKNEKGLEILINILEKYGDKDGFLKALLTKENFPEFKDLKIDKKDNLLSLVKDKKYKIHEFFDDETEFDNFLNALLKESYRISGKVIGAGELFLITLFKDAKHPDKSDVNIADNEIEVKFSSGYSKDGGRLTPAKNTLCSVKEMSEYFERLLKAKHINLDGIVRNSSNDILISGKKYINQIFDYLESQGIDKKTTFVLLSKMYFYQFLNIQDKKPEYDRFIANFVKTNDCTFDNLLKIHGALALMSYHKADEWQYLFIGVLQDGSYYMLNGNRCSIDNFENNLKDLINSDNDFTFKNYPSNTDGAQPMLDKVCKIYVKK
jgi:hypothetical protein